MRDLLSHETIGAMRHIAFAALLVACVPPAESPKEPTDHEAPVPHPPRTETVSEETAIDGLTFTLTPVGAEAWRVLVQNESNAPVSIVWDESTFVASNGESEGKLIRGETKKMDAAKAQPPTVVPAKARSNETFLVEKLVAAEDVETSNADTYRQLGYVTSDMNRKLASFRKTVDAIIRGGRISIAVRVGDEPKTWVGIVSK